MNPINNMTMRLVRGISKAFHPNTARAQVPSQNYMGTDVNRESEQDTEHTESTFVPSLNIARSIIPDAAIVMSTGGPGPFPLIPLPVNTMVTLASLAINAIGGERPTTSSKDAPAAMTKVQGDGLTRMIDTPEDQVKEQYDEKRNSQSGEDNVIIHLSLPENQTAISPKIRLSENGFQTAVGSAALSLTEEHGEIASKQVHIKCRLEDQVVDNDGAHYVQDFIDGYVDTSKLKEMYCEPTPEPLGAIASVPSIQGVSSFDPAKSILTRLKDSVGSLAASAATALGFESIVTKVKQAKLKAKSQIGMTPAVTVMSETGIGATVNSHTHKIVVPLPKHNHIVYNIYDTKVFAPYIPAADDAYLNALPVN